MINFDRAANYHAFYRLAGTDIKAGEVHLNLTHQRAFEYLAKAEAFLFRINPHKSPSAKAKILKRLVSMGFTVQPSTQTHYQHYASR